MPIVTRRILITARAPNKLAPYLRAIEAAGGTPDVLDPSASPSERRARFEAADGLVLPGGADVNPSHYGHVHPEGCRNLSVADPALDETELALATWSLDDGKPLLAICRGQQVLAVAAGGTLYCDIPGHVERGTYPAHTIRVTPGSHLAATLDAEHLDVNSRHHQAVQDIPVDAGLRVVAWAEDGTVEGLESTDGRILAVQCHPEDLTERSRPCRRLFENLIQSTVPDSREA